MTVFEKGKYNLPGSGEWLFWGQPGGDGAAGVVALETAVCDTSC